jgi:hypothetical protein
MIEVIQQALFAAYDIRNAMTTSDRLKDTENETFGESIDAIIERLEYAEQQLQEQHA